MRCGRILVEGEAEDVISPKRRQKGRSHGRKSSSNPYSGVGLDKFASLNAELSAKREYVAKKTGAPEAMVRFVYTRHGWVPIVVRQKHVGGVSIKPGNIADQKANHGSGVVSSKPGNRADQENHGSSSNSKENHEKVKSDHGDEGQGNGGDGSEIREESDVVSMPPWWSGCVKETAFGALTVSAIMVRKSAMPATAMAVVMVLSSLQRRWQGGVICMKRFISSGISYFSELFAHWKKTPDVDTMPLTSPAVEMKNPDAERMPLNSPPDEVQQPVASPEYKMISGKRVARGGPLLCVSAPCSPRHRGQDSTAFSAPMKGLEINTQLDGKISVRSHSQEINTQLENKVFSSRKSQEINSQLESKISLPRKSHEISGQRYGKKGNDKNKGKMEVDKNKKFGRILSLDSQLRNSTRLQKAESFARKRKAGRKAVDATIGASVMIVILFFLIAYGRISAIFFTSAWWYVLPNLRTGNSNKRADL